MDFRSGTANAACGGGPPPAPPPRSIKRRGRPRTLAGVRPGLTTEGDYEVSEPSLPLPLRDGWVEVARRPKRVSVRETTSVGVSASVRAPPSARMGGDMGSRHGSVPRRGPPRSAAVAITGLTADFDYGRALIEARSQIPLEELNIQLSRIRRSANGGRIIELPGVDSAKKADDLADRLRAVFGATAKVARPLVRGEIRLTGLDDSVTQEEVRSVIAREGQCPVDNVRTGPIRVLNNGLGAVWIQCPLAAALVVSRPGRLRIGWTIARVELLKSRPVQCFKCWDFGHVRYACKSAKDRSGLCFRCSAPGHSANECRADPRCAVCADRGRECAHRVGSDACLARAASGPMGGRASSHGNTGMSTGIETTRRVVLRNPENGD